MSDRPTLFVSHATDDRVLVQSLGEFLSKLSLKQFTIWFSSDRRADGGLQPGDLWFDQIQTKMRSSAALLVVLTNKSVNRPWIYFESGYGSAAPEKKLLVVTSGISSLSEIPPPLSFWQMFRIDTKEGLSEFSSKLLEIYGIAFDQDLFNAASAVHLRRDNAEEDRVQEAQPSNAGREGKVGGADVGAVLAHIDRRFFELSSSLLTRDQYMSYNVMIINSFDGQQHQLEIFRGMDLQEALDRIWQMISDFVPAYTYLLKWILRHQRTGIPLIVKEVQFALTASDIFKPGATWTVEALGEPFQAATLQPRQRLGDENLD